MTDSVNLGPVTEAPTHDAAAFPAGHDDTPVLTAHRAGLLGCRSCGRVWPDDHTKCERCGARLTPPDRRGLAAVWAWLITGMIFYIPANLMPMMTTQSLGRSTDSTIIGGVLVLIKHGDWFSGGVVFAASVGVPVCKFIVIS